MPTRTAQAEWSGNLARGSGKMAFGSGAFEGDYSFASRFEDGEGTNPEELIAAAHAACFTMAFSNILAEHGICADVWRMPANFPVTPSKGWSFSGMMTPAVDSAYGEYHLFTTVPTASFRSSSRKTW